MLAWFGFGVRRDPKRPLAARPGGSQRGSSPVVLASDSSKHLSMLIPHLLFDFLVVEDCPLLFFGRLRIPLGDPIEVGVYEP